MATRTCSAKECDSAGRVLDEGQHSKVERSTSIWASRVLSREDLGAMSCFETTDQVKKYKRERGLTCSLHISL